LFENAPNLSVEQPLGFADLPGSAYVRSHARTPMVLDESVWGIEAMAPIIQLGACDRIVIKINRVGGMLPGARIIQVAEAAGIGVSLDTNPFTIVGDTASAHLAAIARFANPIECDGHRSFITFGDEDPFTGGIKIKDGMAELPEAPGLGVDVNWQHLNRHLERFAVAPAISNS
jgi:muconate cycloisomerase